MPVANVDTFEHDIAEEIRTREATLTDIASAGGDLGNVPPQARASNLLLILGVICVVGVIAAFLVIVFFMRTPNTSPQAVAPSPTAPVVNLFSLSTYLNDAIAPYVGSISKNEYGYTLRLTQYSPVFAYMIKNEHVYADELALAIDSPRDTGTSSLPFTFTDITLSNQNMRVGMSGSSTVVYAFVNSQALIVSSSTEGILTLRSAILKQ